MSFEYIDDITRADVAIRAHGETLKDLFCSSASGLIATMVDNYEIISRVIQKDVSIENSSIEMLFFNFIDEFLFYKDSENLFLLPENINIIQKGELFILDAKLSGEEIDVEKHSINVDVKAITMHNLSVKQDKKGWVALFVLDV